MRLGEAAVGQAEGGLQRGGRREREVPHRERDRHLRVAVGGVHGDGCRCTRPRRRPPGRGTRPRPRGSRRPGRRRGTRCASRPPRRRRPARARREGAGGAVGGRRVGEADDRLAEELRGRDVPGPRSVAALTETPLAGPVTTTWKASNSFFAAAMAALFSARACSCGRIFSLATAVQTVAARAARGVAERRAASATVRRRRMLKAAPFGVLGCAHRTECQAGLFPPGVGRCGWEARLWLHAATSADVSAFVGTRALAWLRNGALAGADRRSPGRGAGGRWRPRLAAEARPHLGQGANRARSSALRAGGQDAPAHAAMSSRAGRRLELQEGLRRSLPRATGRRSADQADARAGGAGAPRRALEPAIRWMRDARRDER